MYFQEFASFQKEVDEMKRLHFEVVLVNDKKLSSSAFPPKGYLAAIEALASFHAEKAPFMLWTGAGIIAIPYEQVRSIELCFKPGY